MKTALRPTVIALTAGAILIRLLPHPPNFTPVGGIALFGGAKLGRPWNYLLPIFILFITDLFLGFHATMPYVYLSFLITVWLGESGLSHNARLGKVGVAGVASSLIFFLITNFGVWLEGSLYPKTIGGLWQSYIMALPFLRNMLLADLIFSVGFFALYSRLPEYFLTNFDNKLINWLRGGIR